MAAQSIDSVVLELEARTGKFNAEIVGASTTSDKALQRIETSATRMEKQVGQSFGQAAQRARNLGFQISDIGVQLSSGTSPFIVLAQQGPQVANALDGARGAVGRFATFLSGPYGAAVFAATTILGGWIFSNKQAGESVEDLVERMKAQARQTELTDLANERYGQTLEGVRAATKAAEKAVEELRLVQKGQAAQTAENIAKTLQDADALRQATKARLDAAIAILEYQRAASEDTFANSSEGLEQNRLLNQRIESVKELRKELAAAEQEVVKQRRAYNAAISAQTVEQENASAEDKVNRKFNAQIDRAAAAADASKKSQAALRDEIATINAAREAELKRLRDTQRESRKTTPSLPPVTGAEVARALGTTINPGGGTRSVAANKAAGGAANSYHLSGQAIDIPLTVGGKPLTKAGIRAALEPLGIQIRELLGPGDKGHSDHFHVAFDKRRLGADDIALSAQKAADAESRRRQSFENELATLLGDEIAAKRALVESAQEIAKLRLAEIENERKAYNDDLDARVAQRKLTTEEADQLRGINDEQAKYRAELVERNEDIRKFRVAEAERQRDAETGAVSRADQAQVLQGHANLARTLDERNEIERRLIDLQYQEEKARNDYVIGFYDRLKLQKGIAESELAEAKAAAESARIRNGSIAERQGNDLTTLERNDPFSRYLDDTADFKTRAEEATVRQLLEVRDGIAEGLAEELGIKSSFVKTLFTIFLDEAIFRPLAEALRKRQSGGGGGLFSSLINFGTSLFGGGGGGGWAEDSSWLPRASGGHVNAGTMYRVNESGREGFRPAMSGTIIPVGQMNAMASRPQAQGGVTVVRLALSGDIDARIDQRATGVAVEVVREAAGPIAEAGASMALSRASRPSL